jgi:hypothetical protein
MKKIFRPLFLMLVTLVISSTAVANSLADSGLFASEVKLHNAVYEYDRTTPSAVIAAIDKPEANQDSNDIMVAPSAAEFRTMRSEYPINGIANDKLENACDNCHGRLWSPD